MTEIARRCQIVLHQPDLASVPSLGWNIPSGGVCYLSFRESASSFFHPIWLGTIITKEIPAFAQRFALSASLIDWSLYTSKTTSILWLDVWLVSTVLSSFFDIYLTKCHTTTFHFLHNFYGIYECWTRCRPMSHSLVGCHALFQMPSQFCLVCLLKGPVVFS